MSFLKSRKQLNNHIIWLAKCRRTLLGFFQGIKANFHVTLWEMTVVWAAVTGKSFYSVAQAPYTFCPAREIHHLVDILFYVSLCKSKEYVRKAENKNTGGSATPHGPISLYRPWMYTAFSRELDLAQKYYEYFICCSQILLKPHLLYPKGLCHSLKCKHEPFYYSIFHFRTWEQEILWEYVM